MDRIVTDLNAPDRSLELSGDEFRQLVEGALAHLQPHIDSLPEQPAWTSDGGEELARAMREPPPETGCPADELFALLFDRLVPLTYNTASPGYLAYIPGGGVLATAVAELVAAAVNRYVGVWLTAPGLVQLEQNVIRWFCELVGYGPASGGWLTTGGSLANWAALVTARRCRLAEGVTGAVIYTSDQSHHSVMKAAVLAGFGPEQVRQVASDAHFRLPPEALEQAIADDRTAGSRPFAVVANAGTTNTGSIDELPAIADIAERESLWLHVDAAYGGFFLLTERGRTLLHGIERADSVTLDPHKGLFLPYGNGALVVRRQVDLLTTHQATADYMPPMQEDQELVDFCRTSAELSRDFRGLRVWLPLKLYGLATFRRYLDEKLDLARWATVELQKIDGIEIVAAPQLSVVAFRLVRSGLDQEQLNALNRRLLERINAARRILLTPTLLNGRFVIRICVLSFRTHLDRMAECLELIRSAVAAVETESSE